MLDDRNFEIRGKTVLFIVVVFPSLLLLTLLVVLVSWACHVSSPPPPSRGLDAATIKGIPVISLVEGGECSICLGAFGDGERVKILPRCRHCYHSECVDRWLSKEPSCPICRDSLRVDPASQKIVAVVVE